LIIIQSLEHFVELKIIYAYRVTSVLTKHLLNKIVVFNIQEP